MNIVIFLPPVLFEPAERNPIVEYFDEKTLSSYDNGRMTPVSERTIRIVVVAQTLENTDEPTQPADSTHQDNVAGSSISDCFSGPITLIRCERFNWGRHIKVRHVR